MTDQDKRDARARRATVGCCAGCGLPLLGFETTPYTDDRGAVYHSHACYVRCTTAHDA
jgi:hypothetical protein